MIYKKFVPTMFRKHLNIIVASVFINTLVLGLYNHKDHQTIKNQIIKEIRERR